MGINHVVEFYIYTEIYIGEKRFSAHVYTLNADYEKSSIHV